MVNSTGSTDILVDIWSVFKKYSREAEEWFAYSYMRWADKTHQLSNAAD